MGSSDSDQISGNPLLLLKALWSVPSERRHTQFSFSIVADFFSSSCGLSLRELSYARSERRFLLLLLKGKEIKRGVRRLLTERVFHLSPTKQTRSITRSAKRLSSLLRYERRSIVLIFSRVKKAGDDRQEKMVQQNLMLLTYRIYKISRIPLSKIIVCEWTI